MEIDGKLYFALATKEDWENDDFGICLVTEDGDDILLYPLDDDEQYDRIYDSFGDLLFDELSYD